MPCDSVAEKPGRNWALWPYLAKREFESGSWSSDAEYLVHLARRDPDFAIWPTSELRRPMDHLAKILEIRHLTKGGAAI